VTLLVDLLRAEVMACDLLHADDTPIRVLDRAKRQGELGELGELGKGVKEGRIWTYVRDQRPWAGAAPPAAVYYVSADRKGEHPQGHLKASKGILQAEAYGGFKKLYQPGPDATAQFREAACWAHLRRDFHDVWKTRNRRSPRKHLSGSGRSTISKSRSMAARPTTGMPSARPTAGRKLRYSRSGPKRSSAGLTDRFIDSLLLCQVTA
jgi:transposase